MPFTYNQHDEILNAFQPKFVCPYGQHNAKIFLLLLLYSMLILRHNNVCAERLSIHLPWTKWQNKITDDNFKCYFPKLVSFDEKFNEVCSLVCDRWNVIGLDNFLTLNRRQAIIYTKQKNSEANICVTGRRWGLAHKRLLFRDRYLKIVPVLIHFEQHFMNTYQS